MRSRASECVQAPVRWALALALWLSVLAPLPALAAPPSTNVPTALGAPDEPGNFDTVVTATRLAAQKWMLAELPYARSLFWSGALIELTLSVGLPLVRGTDVGAILGTAFSFALRKGFWAMMLETAMTTMPAIVLSLKELGVRASGVTGGITPQAVVDSLGLFTITQWAHVTLNPLTVLEVGVGFLLVVIPFGLCALFTWIAYLRMYFVMGGGLIMLGFAGTTWTEDYARRYLNYVLGSGINLLVIELAKSLFFDYLADWIRFVSQGDETLGLATALRIGLYGTAMAIALISLPGYMAGIANGAVTHAAEALSMAVAPKALMAAGGMLAQSAQALAGAAQTLWQSASQSSGNASQGASTAVVGGPPPSGGFGQLQGPLEPSGYLSAGGDVPPMLPGGSGGGTAGGETARDLGPTTPFARDTAGDLAPTTRFARNEDALERAPTTRFAPKGPGSDPSGTS